MVKAITEKTWIPLGVAIIAIGGGAAWLTTMFVQLQATADTVKTIQTDRKEEQSKYTDHLLKIETDIAEMKGDLKALRRGE